VRQKLALPKKMFWIEALFARMPVDMRKRKEQILLRLFFMFLLWLSGFVAFAVDGLSAEYVSNVALYLAFFGSGFIILFGSYMVQNSLADVVTSIRPLSRLDDSAFKKFFEKVELYSYSFIPDLLIGLLITVVAPGNRITLAHLGGMLESLHAAWTVVFMFFFNLLSATGIWMGVSIWLTIFLISRQPLQVELSLKTAKEFRGLANLALGFAAFYFLAVAMGVILPLSSEPMVSLVDVITSPLVVYLVIGAVGVLLPFYNIHRTLISLKRRELLKIEEEYELMETRLKTAQKEQMQKSSEESLALMHSLSSLQIRERRVKAAKEWPIDIGFVSKLLGLILAPALARLLPEILNWLSL
jgi:hypothetical protein